MDHAYPTTVPFQPLPPEVTATGARMVSYLHSGGRAVVLVGEPGSGKTMTLDAVLAGMPAWVERVSNRVSQPLTLTRILTQVGARPGDDSDHALLQTLRERVNPGVLTLLAVDDAHTLTPEALAALAGIPGHGGPDLPGMVLVLAGEPELLRRLHGPAMTALRGPAVLTLRMPQPGAMAASALASDAAEAGPGAEPKRGWSYVAGLMGLAMLSAALLLQRLPAAALVPNQPTGSAIAGAPSPARPIALAPEPPTPQLANSATAISPEPPVVVAALPPVTFDAELTRPPQPPVGDAQLRRAFDAFLNRAGRDTARLTPTAREALFREYLAWKARAP